jgi:hypothetical protein
MANSTVDTGDNAVTPVPNPTGAVPAIPFPAPTHQPPTRGSDVAPADRDVRPLRSPGGSEGSLGQSQPLPNLTPPTTPGGEREGSGTAYTPGGQGLGRPGRGS